MEHDRFFDIVRQGRAAQLMQADGKNFVVGKNELLPIPATQIALSGGRLIQNPGY
jgi:starch-binding outer membrane protein, SusD/RagB family